MKTDQTFWSHHLTRFEMKQFMQTISLSSLVNCLNKRHHRLASTWNSNELDDVEMLNFFQFRNRIQLLLGTSGVTKQYHLKREISKSTKILLENGWIKTMKISDAKLNMMKILMEFEIRMKSVNNLVIEIYKKTPWQEVNRISNKIIVDHRMQKTVLKGLKYFSFSLKDASFNYVLKHFRWNSNEDSQQQKKDLKRTTIIWSIIRSTMKISMISMISMMI